MNIDNMMTRVKVNNEIDLCEVRGGKKRNVGAVRHKIEAALQYARISYFLRWQEPGFFARIFAGERTKLIFCINSAQLEDAMKVLEGLDISADDVKLLGGKSKNKYVYAE
ncbi:MAG: hypothetical protein K5987_06105 [Lachnospiraceae bacterium]|jgi:hypothetical protein|nr:hypothetical protein [Lachnospiraceae bacterium]MCR4937710.1 hypothetical protein [Lachnospiraceae bacterium]